MREGAERKLAQLDAEKVDLDALRSAASADAEAITEELASTRSSMKQRAVEAYVGASGDQALSILFDTDDVVAAADRRVLLVSQFGTAADDVERYRRLKADTDPRLVELATAIEDLDARMADAADTVIQARAVEADAERAEERARRAALAAAATTTVTTAAPEATAGPSSGAVAASSTSSSSSSTSSTSPAPPSSIAAPTTLPEPPAGGPTEAQWAALRRCESGGNYQIVSANGKYRGAYQFDYGTWSRLGGTGDPAAASPAEQDLRAKILYSLRGARPWPTCGIHLR